ncbi:uncharacterized protein LOC143230449 isoform X2 [Tachypleus tridentatus]|uniref:uncharacterized protein LOC143230449 isoform X2 n=1 Tax=Tachypleus tridentatus TaxID=6853 RepID=UPI003FCF683F
MKGPSLSGHVTRGCHCNFVFSFLWLILFGEQLQKAVNIWLTSHSIGANLQNPERYSQKGRTDNKITMKRLGAFAAIFLLTVFFKQVCGLCNENPSNKMLAFPDIFEVAVSKLGYQVTVEINENEKKESFFTEEYYDIFNKRGRLDILKNGTRMLYAYYEETDELFNIVGNGPCKVTPITSTENLFDKYWTDREMDRVLLGPSAMFRHGYLDYKENKELVVYMGKESSPGVRDMTANRWRQCLDNNQIQIDYYFLDSTWENYLGDKNLPVPLRIVIKSKDIERQFEFLKFIPFIENPSNVFQIPTGLGCERLAQGLKKPVDLSKSNLLLNAELIYVPKEEETNKAYSYSINFKVIYSRDSEHLVHTYNKWERSSTAEAVPVRSSLKDVYGFKDRTLYTINMDYKNCSISRPSSYKPKLYLPFKRELLLTNPNILISNDGFYYMGESEERNIPVSVFEKKVKMFPLGPNILSAFVVITRYYTSNEVSYGSDRVETQVPIRVTLRAYDDLKKPKSISNISSFCFCQLTDLITINVAYFSTEPHDMENNFDVSSCFVDNSMSRWFQISFPLKAYDVLKSLPIVAAIKQNFLQQAKSTADISPLRIPKVMVDFTTKEMFITALLLERPPYFLDFDLVISKGLREPSATFGITTSEDCAKACLESFVECLGFAYCGATCYFTSKEYSEDITYDDNDCDFYKRLIKEEDATPTMDVVASRLSGSVRRGEFYFTIRTADDETTYKALEFYDKLASGINGFEQRPSGSIDSKFTVYKYTTKFYKDESDDLKGLGRVTFETCKRACIDLPLCESLSYCKINGECLLSTKHGSVISDKHLAKDTQCVILTRNYVDAYERLPGITVGSKPKKAFNISDLNECAKACSTEGSFQCKSFDHCPQSKDKKYSCLLHEIHFLDAKDKIVGDKAKVCGHYSRDYIYDFKQTDGKKVNGAKVVELQNVTAKHCAKRCVENAEFSCQSFDFCQATTLDKSTCLLIGKGNSKMDFIEAPVCAHYEYLGTIEPSLDERSRYSTGLGIGLAFFFIILGIILGAVALFIYGYRKANK